MSYLKSIKISAGAFLLFLYLFFCWLMLKIILQYIPAGTDTAFLGIKQDYTRSCFYLGLCFACRAYSIFKTGFKILSVLAQVTGQNVCVPYSIISWPFGVNHRLLCQWRHRFPYFFLLAGQPVDLLYLYGLLPRKTKKLRCPQGVYVPQLCPNGISTYPEGLEIYIGCCFSSSSYGCLPCGGLVGMGAKSFTC